MPVELGPSFPTSFAGIPPHVSQNDLVLWEQFREIFSDQFDRFYFDVGLGEGVASAPGVPANIAAAFSRLSRFRADVVGENSQGWTIVELRPNAGPGALGAIQVYATLWRQDPPDPRPMSAMIFTDICKDEIKAIASVAGIRVLCTSEL